MRLRASLYNFVWAFPIELYIHMPFSKSAHAYCIKSGQRIRSNNVQELANLLIFKGNFMPTDTKVEKWMTK